MKSRDKKRLAVGILTAAMALVIVCVAVYIIKNNESGKVSENMRENTQPAVSQSSENVVTYEGKKYKYNRNLVNILFLGIDKKEPVVLQDTPGTAGQADCIMILSLDRETETVRVLQISRDAMTDIDIYDANGNYFTSVKAQLATQYAYGNGGDSSCWAVKKTVSELLFDLPIDGYMSVNIDGISTMNDAVGGVTLTMPEDYTAIDPAFVKGETITLNGEQAEKYVRYRDTAVQGSNNGRMLRQVQYIPALISAVRSKVGDSGDYYKTFYPIISPYLVTDLKAEQINDMGKYQLLEDKTEFVPGEVRAGEKNEEYHVDDEKLQRLLLEMFYKLQD